MELYDFLYLKPTLCEFTETGLRKALNKRAQSVFRMFLTQKWFIFCFVSVYDLLPCCKSKNTFKEIMNLLNLNYDNDRSAFYFSAAAASVQEDTIWEKFVEKESLMATWKYHTLTKKDSKFYKKFLEFDSKVTNLDKQDMLNSNGQKKYEIENSKHLKKSKSNSKFFLCFVLQVNGISPLASFTEESSLVDLDLPIWQIAWTDIKDQSFIAKRACLIYDGFLYLTNKQWNDELVYRIKFFIDRHRGYWRHYWEKAMNAETNVEDLTLKNSRLAEQHMCKLGKCAITWYFKTVPARKNKLVVSVNNDTLPPCYAKLVTKMKQTKHLEFDERTNLIFFCKHIGIVKDDVSKFFIQYSDNFTWIREVIRNINNIYKKEVRSSNCERLHKCNMCAYDGKFEQCQTDLEDLIGPLAKHLNRHPVDWLTLLEKSKGVVKKKDSGAQN